MEHFHHKWIFTAFYVHHVFETITKTRNKLGRSLLSFRILILFKARLPVCKCVLSCYSMSVFFLKSQLHAYNVLGTAQRTSILFCLLSYFNWGCRGASGGVCMCVCCPLLD